MIDNYNKLPLGKYIDIISLCEDEGYTPIDRNTAIIAILMDKTAEEVAKMPLFEYKAASAALDFLELPVEPTKHLAHVYKVGGFELKPTIDLRKFTASQYIDFQAFSEAGDARLPELLSCLMVPKGCTYNDGYDIAEVHEAIRNGLSTTDAFTLSAFFLTWLYRLTFSSLIYSKLMLKRYKGKNQEKARSLKKKIAEAETLLRKSGDGLTPYIWWRTPQIRHGIQPGAWVF